ncbi:hypothetical protein Fmac_030539 [Flemingia macrophylla]|uniref:Cytochrome P450 n=1 Tax=Flemingia macrophylla TaxID=520843 RepID=A0ABD1KZG1_9FABA
MDTHDVGEENGEDLVDVRFLRLQKNGDLQHPTCDSVVKAPFWTFLVLEARLLQQLWIGYQRNIASTSLMLHCCFQGNAARDVRLMGMRYQPRARFLDSSIDYKDAEFQFIPLAGRRVCPELHFGIANIEFSLANSLFKFDWKMARGNRPEELDMAETPGLTVKRKQDLL